MILENQVYVPTLAVRPSEMNGLEFLPGATKDRMTPCFLLAPWSSSNTLDRTIARIERAYPNRNYFLDIDQDYSFTNDGNGAQRQLRELMSPTDCFSNWVSFIEHNTLVWPCLQLLNQTEREIRQQVLRFQAVERPFCLRIVQGRTRNIDAAIKAVAAGGTSDFAIILEGGWTQDPLTLSAWFIGVITQSLQAIDASVPIVVSCTSIPTDFTPYNQRSPVAVPFGNRLLVEQVIRTTNRVRVIYGDWGSTRPRTGSSFGQRPLDRVDYPRESAWYIARNKEDEWTFRDAAIAIVKSPHWDGTLGIWGEEMIENTTVNQELGIDTAPKNVATRVNIHLHRQAFFGQPVDPSTFDEDWQD